MIPEWLHAHIDSGLADGCPCLVGTVSADGAPQISPKGSVLVLDARTLAYWERSRRSTMANVAANASVVVFYRNPALRETRLPLGGIARFYGTATVHADGPTYDAVKARVIPIELERDTEGTGVAVTIALDRAEDLAGQPLE